MSFPSAAATSIYSARSLTAAGCAHCVEYAEGKLQADPAVTAALEGTIGVRGLPSRVELWQAAFTTGHYKQLLDCITAATSWPAEAVPDKIAALYTQLSSLGRSGSAAVPAQFVDDYLEIPVSAVAGPEAELAVCVASFFNIPWRQVHRGWAASAPTDD